MATGKGLGAGGEIAASISKIKSLAVREAELVNLTVAVGDFLDQISEEIGKKL